MALDPRTCRGLRWSRACHDRSVAPAAISALLCLSVSAWRSHRFLSYYPYVYLYTKLYCDLSCSRISQRNMFLCTACPHGSRHFAQYWPFASSLSTVFLLSFISYIHQSYFYFCLSPPLATYICFHRKTFSGVEASYDFHHNPWMHEKEGFKLIQLGLTLKVKPLM